MNNFGFTISQPRSIEVKDNIQDQLLLLEKRVPSFKRCIKCGGCTATCTSGHFTQFNIRKIHSLYQWGVYDGLEDELQKCMLCGKCTLVCPRGVNLRDLIINLRKILSKQNK
ncbi:MAG: 4Fe-4S dicluster domain-containing protein [Tannerella sp.]|jgi:heterodisulfide reductase subunit C|nr:4Fe-4S dicluster domain-containing protein [Tannerella sp.]